MSLDISIKAKVPVVKNGIGIFVRENGKTKELTAEEAKERGWDGINREYVSEYAWTGNITHNLSGMAKAIKPKGIDYTLYELLWMGMEKSCADLYGKLLMCIEFTIRNKTYLERFNPPNGWGDYRTLLNFIIDLAFECEKNKDCTIEICR